MSTTENITPDYEEKINQNTAERDQKLAENEQMYDDIEKQYNDAVDSQIQGLERQAAQQRKLINQQTQFAIEKIEQQKAETEEDYHKEQSASYVDFKKQSNQYGIAAEQQAAAGMTGSGYSESSQVAMYNQYQNRIAIAREAFSDAIVEYNNAITEAKLAGSAALAQIAAETFAAKSALIVQQAAYMAELALQEQAAAAGIENTYYNREQQIIANQNTATATARQNTVSAILAGRDPSTITDEELAAAGMTRAEADAYYGQYKDNKAATDADLNYRNQAIQGQNYSKLYELLYDNGVDPSTITDEELAAAGMTRAMAKAIYDSGVKERAGTSGGGLNLNDGTDGGTVGGVPPYAPGNGPVVTNQESTEPDTSALDALGHDLTEYDVAILEDKGLIELVWENGVQKFRIVDLNGAKALLANRPPISVANGNSSFGAFDFANDFVQNTPGTNAPGLNPMFAKVGGNPNINNPVDPATVRALGLLMNATPEEVERVKEGAGKAMGGIFGEIIEGIVDKSKTRPTRKGVLRDENLVNSTR